MKLLNELLGFAVLTFRENMLRWKARDYNTFPWEKTLESTEA